MRRNANRMRCQEVDQQGNMHEACNDAHARAHAGSDAKQHPAAIDGESQSVETTSNRHVYYCLVQLCSRLRGPGPLGAAMLIRRAFVPRVTIGLSSHDASVSKKKTFVNFGRHLVRIFCSELWRNSWKPTCRFRATATPRKLLLFTPPKEKGPVGGCHLKSPVGACDVCSAGSCSFTTSASRLSDSGYADVTAAS